MIRCGGGEACPPGGSSLLCFGAGYGPLPTTTLVACHVFPALDHPRLLILPSLYFAAAGRQEGGRRA